MKKFFVTILAFSYLITSVGATVHLHYCMDKLVSWSLSDNSIRDKCGNCGMKKDDNCCKDQHKFVKNNSDQKTTATLALNVPFLIAAISPAIIDEAEYYFSYAPKYYNSHAPPISSDGEIYLRNCVFRI